MVEFKHYGLKGKRIKVKLIDSWNTIYDNVWLPCKVIEEYPKFLRVEVLPHRNPHESFDVSKPYIMCLNKANIECCGTIKVKEM